MRFAQVFPKQPKSQAVGLCFLWETKKFFGDRGVATVNSSPPNIANFEFIVGIQCLGRWILTLSLSIFLQQMTWFHFDVIIQQ